MAIASMLGMQFFNKTANFITNQLGRWINDTQDYNLAHDYAKSSMKWARESAENAGFSPLASLGMSPSIGGSTYQSDNTTPFADMVGAIEQQKQIQQFEAEQAEKDRQFQAQENKLNREKANELTSAQVDLVKAQTEEQNAQTRIAEANASDAEINAEINRLFPWLRTDDNSKQAQIIRQSISLGNKMVNSDLPKDERIIKINDMLALTGIPDSYVKNMRKTSNGYEFYCTDSKGVQFIIYMDKNGNSYNAKTPDGKRYYLP